MLGAVIITTVMLGIGVALRSRFSIFATARIPASLLAGALGLIAAQLLRYAFWAAKQAHLDAGWISESQSFYLPSMANLRLWPSWLIAVVFAGMLLSKSRQQPGSDDQLPEPIGQESERERFSPIAREALMVWIIAIGQTAIGLSLVWWWAGPQFGLPASAGMLIETGFAGGHGTAAAMGTVLAHPRIGMSTGLDLGILMATLGLVYGLVSGIAWIEVGVRCGWIASGSSQHVRPPVPAEQRGNDAPNRECRSVLRTECVGNDRIGLGEPRDEPDATAQGPGESKSSSIATRGMGAQRSPRPSSDAIDPLLLQLVWLMLAFTVGLGLRLAADQMAAAVDSVGWFATASAGDSGADISGADVLRDRLRISSVVGSFPLFIYTLFGGAIVRFAIVHTAGEHWIDHQRIQRLVGSSMDLLVVAAVATLNLAVVASLWIPMLGLFLCGAIWSTFCLLVLSRKILPESHWFELGLINFGMSTGTTATGFVLLRVVDPDLETPAAKQYALAAPLSAPFVGGGMITVGLPLLLLERVPIGISAVGMSLLLLGLIAWGIVWKSRITVARTAANAEIRSAKKSVVENR